MSTIVKTIDVSPDETDGEDRDISTYLKRAILAQCANCRKRETVQPDIMARAVELLRQRGWKVRGIRLLCKECANE